MYSFVKILTFLIRSLLLCAQPYVFFLLLPHATYWSHQRFQYSLSTDYFFYAIYSLVKATHPCLSPASLVAYTFAKLSCLLFFSVFFMFSSFKILFLLPRNWLWFVFVIGMDSSLHLLNGAVPMTFSL